MKQNDAEMKAIDKAIELSKHKKHKRSLKKYIKPIAKGLKSEYKRGLKVKKHKRLEALPTVNIWGKFSMTGRK